MNSNPTSQPLDFAAAEAQGDQPASLMFAWRRKWIVVVLLLIGLGLGYLYFLRQIPVYQSKAQILLVERHAKLPIEGLEVKTGYEIKPGADTTHETLISSPIVAKLAIDKYDLKSLPSFQGMDDPTLALIAGLEVKSGGPTRNKGDVIELRFKSLHREDCPKVLEAMVGAYTSFLGSTYKDVSEEATSLIVKAKDEVGKQLTETEDAYRTFRNGAPLLFTNKAGQNMHEARLAQIEAERSAAVVDSSKTQAKIDAIEDALRRGGSREAINLMVAHLKDETHPGNVTGKPMGEGSLQSQLLPLLLEEQALLQSFGPDHPKVVAIRQRKSTLLEYSSGREQLPDPKEAAGNGFRDFLEVYLESLHEQMKFNDKMISRMGELFDTERQASKTLSANEVEDETRRSDLDRKRRLYDAIIKRLEEINLVKNSDMARIQLIHPPVIGSQVEPNFQKTMLVAGLLGALAGLGLAYVVDQADRRFRNPDEIRQGLGLPVMGHIPVIAAAGKDKSAAGNPTGMSHVLCTHHQPRSRTSEAYRAVRTALYFSTRGSGNQVIQVTSPSPSDGKTTLASNLAISMAQSGKSVLLLDADFRRPRVHRLFSVDNAKGMSDVLTGTVELADVLRTTAVKNLTVLPCGTRPENPAELLTGPRFEELLGVIREKFEFVIVDTPPLLAVTDPLNVVGRVDGVVMVMRLTKHARSNSRRAVSILEEHGANILGIVVNGVGGKRGSGSGYGSYGYAGYGYGENYGGYGGTGRYGYASSDGNDKGYYEEGETANHSKNGAGGQQSNIPA